MSVERNYRVRPWHRWEIVVIGNVTGHESAAVASWRRVSWKVLRRSLPDSRWIRKEIRRLER